MFGYVTVGTNNVEAARAFYDALGRALGWERVFEYGKMTGYGTPGQREMLVVTMPENRQAATVGNGVMVALLVDSKAEVDRLHALAVDLGAANEGDPGVRAGGLYSAYWRDPDGNKFNFHTLLAGKEESTQ